MSAHDETRQTPIAPAAGQTAAPDAPTTQLRAPGPLDLAGPTETDTTGVLPLDELFETHDDDAGTTSTPPAEAATRTAMPVIPVRSEPLDDAATASSRPVTSPAPAKTGPGLAERLLDDGAAAWDGAIRRAERWLRAGDNTMMVVTALAAIVLILVVATFGG